MRVQATAAVKRLSLRANQLYWKTYWNWYWNLRHNRFYANIAKYPLGLTIGVCGFRYTTGDGIAQWSTRGMIDRKRTTTFLVFGLWSGVYNYYMYSRFYPMLIRRFSVSPIFCITFENTVSCPMIYYGAFYVTQHFIQSGQIDLRSAVQTANTNRIEDIKSLWMFWGPMHFISFNYVHPSMRGAFAGLVGTGWVLLLSLLRGDPHADHTEETEEEGSAAVLEETVKNTTAALTEVANAADLATMTISKQAPLYH